MNDAVTRVSTRHRRLGALLLGVVSLLGLIFSSNAEARCYW